MALTGEDISQLYALHATELLRHFARRTFDPEVAVDLVAETFARAFERRADLRDAEPEAARAWLFTVARRLLVDEHRRGVVDRAATLRLGIERRPLHDEEHDRIERLASTERLRALVADALASLPEDQRAALRLRVVDERPYPAIARALGVSEQVVRARVSRGLRTLRRHLALQESPEHA
ncbi:sigma-70 family RNA polymerase sigma factor [Patulibacter sp. NPDC049589]|uniref:RNA polymerase sigma factor n=1 Tax=Patulibacter sp. NPDC049589 TaxID=3154731 RepID=UPI0034413D2B